MDVSRLVAGISARHDEIMRGELASILYEATRHDVEYRFGDSIRTLHLDGDGVEVTFERGPPRRFGLVVGAGYSQSRGRRRDGAGGRRGVRARGELQAAGGDHAGAFGGYERAMGELVRRSRGIGPATMEALIPRTPTQVWLTPQLLRLVSRLPGPLQRRRSGMEAVPARALEAVDLERYHRPAGCGD